MWFEMQQCNIELLAQLATERDHLWVLKFNSMLRALYLCLLSYGFDDRLLLSTQSKPSAAVWFTMQPRSTSCLLSVQQTTAISAISRQGPADMVTL